MKKNSLFILFVLFLVLAVPGCKKAILSRKIVIKVCDTENQPLDKMLVSVWQADEDMFWTGCDYNEMTTDSKGECVLDWKPCKKRAIHMDVLITLNNKSNYLKIEGGQGYLNYSTSIDEFETYKKDTVKLIGNPITKCSLILKNIRATNGNDRIRVNNELLDIMHYGTSTGEYPIYLNKYEDIKLKITVRFGEEFEIFEKDILYGDLVNNNYVIDLEY